MLKADGTNTSVMHQLCRSVGQSSITVPDVTDRGIHASLLVLYREGLSFSVKTLICFNCLYMLKARVVINCDQGDHAIFVCTSDDIYASIYSSIYVMCLDAQTHKPYIFFSSPNPTDTKHKDDFVVDIRYTVW